MGSFPLCKILEKVVGYRVKVRMPRTDERTYLAYVFFTWRMTFSRSSICGATRQWQLRNDRARVAGGRAVLLLLCCWPSGARGLLLWLLLLLELVVVVLAVLLLLLLVVAVQQ